MLNKLKCSLCPGQNLSLENWREPNQHHGPKCLCDVVTGNETWLFFYGIPNKRSNRMWMASDCRTPVVLRPGFQTGSDCFPLLFFFQHTRSSNGWHSTPEVNTHCNILCWNCSTSIKNTSFSTIQSVHKHITVNAYTHSHIYYYI